jgi:1,4-dihydroxy-2-naphthoyl-CoA hydrolase
MQFLIKPSLKELNDYCKNTIAEFLGIEFVEIGMDYLVARMPVNAKTHQPLGMLHGGASCVLAEQAGSMAANLFLDRKTQVALGLDINANHVKSVKEGYVYGKASPIHIGTKTQVWEIKITNETGELISLARLTMMVIPINNEIKRRSDLLTDE